MASAQAPTQQQNAAPLPVNPEFQKLPSRAALERAVAALKTRGHDAVLVETLEEAKAKVLELVPKGSEVFVYTSMTATAVGVEKVFNDSGEYKSVRKLLLDKAADKKEQRRAASAPDFAVGSTHALTEDGVLMWDSATGSQFACISSGAEKVVVLVGGQKVVKDKETGFRRLHETTYPLEDARARVAYGMGSAERFQLQVYGSAPWNQGRFHVVLINQVVGF